jgi:hypothetical protein
MEDARRFPASANRRLKDVAAVSFGQGDDVQAVERRDADFDYAPLCGSVQSEDEALHVSLCANEG